MSTIVVNVPTVEELHKIMEKYEKLYSSVSLKYDFKTGKAKITLEERKVIAKKEFHKKNHIFENVEDKILKW